MGLFFDRLTISKKLFIFLLLPVSTLLFFASITLIEKQQQLKKTQNTLHFSYLSQKLSAVIYQLQKERGLNAGAVGSNGHIYLEMLAKQRIETDKTIANMAAVFSQPPSYLDKESRVKLKHLNRELLKLNAKRTELDQAHDNDFFDFYSRAISDILNVVSYLPQLSVNLEQKDIASSYLDSLWLEEYSGQERGKFNGIFTSQHFNANQFSTILRYIASQDAAIAHFYNTAKNEHQVQMRQVLSTDPANQIKHYREIIFNKAQRNDALNGLQILIGYGGFIHNFKNYVIRGDDYYAKRVKQQLEKAYMQIQAYQLLPNINTKERQALDTINHTLHKYQDKLPLIAAMKIKQAPVSEIDQAVKVNDQPALSAIDYLRQNITRHNPKDWWKNATQRLNLIHQVSSSIAEDLILLSKQNQQQTQQILYLYSISTLFVILLSSLLGFKLRTRLVGEIKYIANVMRKSQKSRQFHQILTLTGHDEITEMARAFNRLIAERANAEEKLKLAAQVFSNAHEGIIITDLSGCIVNVNPTFCEITGYSREEVIAANPSLLSSGKHGSEFYAEMWGILIKQYAEMLTISAIKDDKNQTTHYVALFSDITKNTLSL